MEMVDPIVFRLTIFVLAIFVGYFVVWSVTPALHTPLMAVTNAISSVIVVGALIAVAVSTQPKADSMAVSADQSSVVSVQSRVAPAEAMPEAPPAAASSAASDSTASTAHAWTSKGFGFLALILACVNIFGGFLVTQRMLAMYKKKGA